MDKGITELHIFLLLIFLVFPKQHNSFGINDDLFVILFEDYILSVTIILLNLLFVKLHLVLNPYFFSLFLYYSLFTFSIIDRISDLFYY